MFTISLQLTLRNYLVNRKSFVNFLHFHIFYRKAIERLFNIMIITNQILDFFANIYFGVFYAQKGVLLLNVCLYVCLERHTYVDSTREETTQSISTKLRTYSYQQE